MKFNLTNFAESVSYLLDFPGVGIVDGFTLNHGKRVAYISTQIAKILRLSWLEMTYLYYLGLLHDMGLIEGSKEAHNLDSLLKTHSSFGEEHIKKLIFTDKININKVLLYHHERFDGKGPFKIKGAELPVFSKIIIAADQLDLFFDQDKGYYIQIGEIHDFINDNTKKIFDPDIAKIMLELTKQEKFWLDYMNFEIGNILEDLQINLIAELSTDQLIQISKIFAVIIDNKSKFTSKHSSGVAEKTVKMGKFYNFDDEIIKKLSIAAYLHDLGKIAVPNTILEKIEPLTKGEFDIIKTHPYYTKYALKKIKGFEDITKWASNHHEKLNGTGYPEKIIPQSSEEQIIGCLDIFQALTEDRPYRKGFKQDSAFKIMDEMAEKKEISKDIVDDIRKVF